MKRGSVEPSVREMPGPRAREWASHHRSTAATSTFVYDFVWDVTAEAVGPFCTDIDGNVLLDFTSHIGAAPLGYNNQKIVAKLREFDLPDPTKIAGQDFYVGSPGSVENPDLPGPTQLQDRLLELTNHYGMDKVFLSNSGAEAVENAIKICYASSKKKRAITFERGFHGRTLGALSLNRSKAVHRQGYPEIGGIETAPFCSCAFDDITEHGCTCGFFTDGSSVLRDRLSREQGYLRSDEIAYMIVEPVQGEGGINVANEAFMQELHDLCTLFDISLIADEVQSGLGRTGELWASDHYAIEPDVITAGKGLRVGATVSRSDLFPEERGRLSSTWGGGDVLASLQGVLTIDIINDENLASNALRRGRQIQETIEDAALPTVIDIRGKGLLVGIEFDTKDHRDAVVRHSLRHGLLTLGCGYKTLRLLPPLDVTAREIELGMNLLVSAIEAVGSK